MKAVKFVETGARLEFTEIDKPKAEPGRLVFKVKACGICGSDLHSASTPGVLVDGVVLGHEYSGEVVEIGADVEGWKVGDRLISYPGMPCGECELCQNGKTAKCKDFVMQGFDLRMQGAYAEYATCVAEFATKVPDNLADTEAATIEPLAVGLNAWKRAEIKDGSNVLILGAGIIGLAVAKWARFFGATTVGISEMVPARIERAKQVGADVVINATDFADPVAEYKRQTGQVPTVIFECIGQPMIDKMIEMAPTDAHLVLVGTGLKPENFTVVSAALKRLRMTFTVAYKPSDFSYVMKMLAAKRISIDPLISATVALPDLPDMFEKLGAPNDHCKVLLTP